MLDAIAGSVAYSTETSFPRGLSYGTTDRGVRKASVDADQVVLEAIAMALGRTGHSALRELEIEVEGEVVVLWGRVPSYYQKQLAQETVQQVHGAGRVANGIEVVCCRTRGPTCDGI